MTPAPRQSPRLCALGGFLALALPALWLGPWIPFVDAINFAAMNSYPPALSYGPYHYYVFQFTYVLPMVLSRLCVDLGIGVGRQVLLFYLAEALIFFGVTWKVLELTVRNRWILGCAIAAGVLAFWDGMFLWGGPLAFTLSAALLGLAALSSLQEAADPHRPRSFVWFSLLVLVSVASHPFSLPFALVLLAVRMLFLPSARWKSAALALALVAYAIVIRHDSPEHPESSMASALFSPVPREILVRISSLFTWNQLAALDILSIASPALSAYFVFLGAIHLAGFVTAPVVLWLARDKPAIRMLAALNTIVAATYAIAMPNHLISMWPHRILSFSCWLTYAAGIACPLYLLSRWIKAGALRRAFDQVSAHRAARALPAGLLAAMVVIQTPVLRLGRNIPLVVARARQLIIDTGLTQVSLYPEVQRITPFYLRCVPFILFSDPDLISHGILLHTEWHSEPRHPSRINDFGLTRYRIFFFNQPDGQIAIRLRGAPPDGWGARSPAPADDPPKIVVYSKQNSVTVDREPFFWMESDLALDLVSPATKPGDFVLSFYAVAGPSRATRRPTIVITELTDAGNATPPLTMNTDGWVHSRLSLNPGSNLVAVRVVGAPNSGDPPGATGKHVVGIHKLSLVAADRPR